MNKKPLKALSELLGLLMLTLASPNLVSASKTNLKKSKFIDSPKLTEFPSSYSSESESSDEIIDISTPPTRNSPDLNLKRKTSDSSSSFEKTNKKTKAENDNVNGGIYNIGSNCYINALLQQLYDVDDFRNWILNFEIDSNSVDEKVFKKIKAMRYLFNRMCDKQWPYNYEDKLEKKMNILGYKGLQEDPQELIQLTWANLFDLFKNISQNENFLFTNPMCVNELNTSKTIQIPHTVSGKFILLLNRTEFQKDTYTYKKNTTILNLKDILLHNPNYKITGVITHEGNTIRRGHYISYKYNKTNQKWYSYNDSKVKEIDAISVLKNAETNAIAIVFTDVNTI